jgi:hypothetical protein
MKKVAAAYVAIVLLVLATSPAFAYLDPGTGSVILQGIIATLATVGAATGMHWRRIKSSIQRLTGRSAGQEKKSGNDDADLPGR